MPWLTGTWSPSAAMRRLTTSNAIEIRSAGFPSGTVQCLKYDGNRTSLPGLGAMAKSGQPTAFGAASGGPIRWTERDCGANLISPTTKFLLFYSTSLAASPQYFRITGSNFS